MARNGQPPRPRSGSHCRACFKYEKTAMQDGLFCSDHELLWIAKSGVVSNNLPRKYGKMYRQFINQQHRAANLEFALNLRLKLNNKWEQDMAKLWRLIQQEMDAGIILRS